MSTQVPPFI